MFDVHATEEEDKLVLLCALDRLGGCTEEQLLRFVVEVSEKDIFSSTRTLNRDLLLGFRKLGVECPFPQLDVHNK